MTKLSKHVEENPNLRTSPQPRAAANTLTWPQAGVRIALILAAAYTFVETVDVLSYWIFV